MESKKKIPAKRVNVVSLKVVKESSVLYETRNITNPYDAFRLVKSFLENSDREKFVVACLDTKNQPCLEALNSLIFQVLCSSGRLSCRHTRLKYQEFQLPVQR